MKKAELDKFIKETDDLVKGMTDKTTNVQKCWEKYNSGERGTKKYATETRKALQEIVEVIKTIKKNILIIKAEKATEK